MRRRVQQDGIDVEYIPEFLPADVTARLFAELQSLDGWHQPEIRFRGNTVLTPRLVAWYARDPQFTYSWSGQTQTPVLWHEASPIQEILALVEAQYGPQDAVLLNWYRDGQDSVAPHSDDERDLKPGSAILGVSLGGERNFTIKHKETKERYVFPLEDGSLVTMRGETQKVAMHGVPKTSKAVGPRISLTFRQMR